MNQASPARTCTRGPTEESLAGKPRVKLTDPSALQGNTLRWQVGNTRPMLSSHVQPRCRTFWRAHAVLASQRLFFRPQRLQSLRGLRQWSLRVRHGSPVRPAADTRLQDSRHVAPRDEQGHDGRPSMFRRTSQWEVDERVLISRSEMSPITAWLGRDALHSSARHQPGLGTPDQQFRYPPATTSPDGRHEF